MHKLKQKLKLTLTVLGLFPVKHHPSFPSSQTEQLICQNISLMYQNNHGWEIPTAFVSHFTLNSNHGKTQNTQTNDMLL